MMDIETERMSAELAEELAANNVKRLIDSRSLPVRFSHMKSMAQSGQHALHAFQQSDYRQSLAMRIGSGGHAMLFGDKDVTMWTGPVRRGKVWDAFAEAHKTSVILNRKEHERATAIVNAIKQHDEASALLFSPGIVHEKTILWEQLGRSRRTTPDAWSTDHVVELKTTRCAHPERFVRDGMFRAYHAQCADHIAAVEHETGKRPPKAYIVAVESAPPYPVQVFEISQRALDRGAAMCRMWLEQLLVCEASNHWPSYSQCLSMFDVPNDDVELTFGDEGDAP